ncbi:MAG: pilin [Candidatus Saccharimonadales bacterium]
MKAVRLAAAALIVILGFLFVVPTHSVQAVDVLKVCNDTALNSSEPSVCKDRTNYQGTGGNPLVGPSGILTTYIHILSLIVAIAAVIMIIVSGLRFMTSNGDPQTAASAQKGLLYAVVGLAVAAFTQLIVSFVISKL